MCKLNNRYGSFSFRLLALLLLAMMVAPAAARAQQLNNTQLVYGRLLDDATRQPIVDGAVSLLRKDGVRVMTVLTDGEGRFRLLTTQPGEYKLKAERIGYKTGESKIFTILAADNITMDFWLSTSAVLMAPIEVKASTRPWNDRYNPAGMDQFYERMRWFEKIGGVFLARQAIRDWEGGRISDMLAAIAGAQVDRDGGILLRQNCRPTYYLNGHPLRLDMGETIDRMFSPSELEGVEIYKGAGVLPAEFGGAQADAPAGGSATGCAVVLWTRRGGGGGGGEQQLRR